MEKSQHNPQLEAQPAPALPALERGLFSTYMIAWVDRYLSSHANAPKEFIVAVPEKSRWKN